MTIIAGTKDSKSDSQTKPQWLKDPDAVAAVESLEDPEEREDLIDALKVLDKLEREGTIPWEETKKRLGL